MSATAKLTSEVKKKIGEVSEKVLKAEKQAEAQIGDVLKKVEKIRKEQAAHVKKLMADARRLKSKELMKHVESARTEIEGRAKTGFEGLLKKLNLPTNKEIDKLNRKIAALEKRLKDLDTELYGKQ